MTGVPGASVATIRVTRSRAPVLGTELDGTQVGGDRRGVRGLWVELRHRRRRPATAGETPDENDDTDVPVDA